MSKPSIKKIFQEALREQNFLRQDTFSSDLSCAYVAKTQWQHGQLTAQTTVGYNQGFSAFMARPPTTTYPVTLFSSSPTHPLCSFKQLGQGTSRIPSLIIHPLLHSDTSYTPVRRLPPSQHNHVPLSDQGTFSRSSLSIGLVGMKTLYWDNKWYRWMKRSHHACSYLHQQQQLTPTAISPSDQVCRRPSVCGLLFPSRKATFTSWVLHGRTRRQWNITSQYLQPELNKIHNTFKAGRQHKIHFFPNWEKMWFPKTEELCTNVQLQSCSVRLSSSSSQTQDLATLLAKWDAVTSIVTVIPVALQFIWIPTSTCFCSEQLTCPCALHNKTLPVFLINPFHSWCLPQIDMEYTVFISANSPYARGSACIWNTVRAERHELFWNNYSGLYFKQLSSLCVFPFFTNSKNLCKL